MGTSKEQSQWGLYGTLSWLLVRFFFFFNNSQTQTQHTNTHTDTQLNTIYADYIIPSLEYCQSDLLVLMEITIKMCKGI